MSRAAVFLSLLFPAPGHASDAAEQARLLLLMFRYDRDLSKQAESVELPVLLLFSGDATSSKKQVTELRGTVDSLAHESKPPLQLKLLAAAYAGSEEFRAQVREEQAKAVYVGPGLSAYAPTIVAITRALGVRSYTGDELSVRAGVAVGLGLGSAPNHLLINLAATQAEQMHLESGVMAHAEVLGMSARSDVKWVFIGHPGASPNTDSEKLRDAFSGEDLVAYDGAFPKIVLAVPGSPARTAFLQEILHETDHQFQASWRQLAFSRGGAVAPITAASEEDVVREVASQAHAFGIVSPGVSTSGVTVINVRRAP